MVHLNNVISSNKATDAPIDSNILNYYFTSVFKQAPKLLPNQTSTLPDNTYVPSSLFLLLPLTKLLIHLLMSTSHAIGSDGMLVKANAVHISQQTYTYRQPIYCFV